MVAYLKKTNELMKVIPIVSIKVMPRSKNTNADALVKLDSTKDETLLEAVSVKFLAERNIKRQPEVMELEHKPSWMDTIVAYLKSRELPENKMEARVLRLKATRYVIYDDKLYKGGYSMPLLKCVAPSEAEYIIREIHKGHMPESRQGAILSVQGFETRILLVNNEN